MLVAVEMNLQKPAALDLMEAASFEVNVGYESLDSGQGFQEPQADCRVELSECISNMLAE